MLLAGLCMSVPVSKNVFPFYQESKRKTQKRSDRFMKRKKIYVLMLSLALSIGNIFPVLGADFTDAL